MIERNLSQREPGHTGNLFLEKKKGILSPEAPQFNYMYKTEPAYSGKNHASSRSVVSRFHYRYIRF
jgi:hypothetical protein